MKKVNKILMIVTSILLSLVLISTCIVSGTLAKFVITKDATTVVALKKFGITMQVQRGSTVKSDYNKLSASVSWSLTDLYPGYNTETDDLLVKFSGNLNVPATLKIKVDVELDDEVFYISSTDFSSLTTNFPANKAYMPLNFKVGYVQSATSNKVKEPEEYAWLRGEKVSSLETLLEQKICETLKDFLYSSVGYNDEDGNRYVYQAFSKTNEIIVGRNLGKGFGLRINWSKGNDSSTSADDKAKNMIEAWIADKVVEKQKANPDYVPMTVTFTVSLEQTGT